MLRLVALLNEIVHYTSAEDLINDLYDAAIRNLNGIRSLNDSFGYPMLFFRRGVEILWDEIQKDGYLSNELLEEKMFTEHECKVKEFGLEAVIESDYSQDDPCHPEVYSLG